MSETPENVQANWCLELITECPECFDIFNVLDQDDFWDGRSLELGETNTLNSKNIEVICPRCGHEFKVDTVY